MNPAAPFVIAAAVLFFIVLVWAIATYNGLVRLRQHVAESWSTIDTELKRRHDLIPNLVEVCRGYAAHEQSVFEQVARARGEAAQTTDASVSPDDQARRESALTGSLRTLFAVSEGTWSRACLILKRRTTSKSTRRRCGACRPWGDGHPCR